MKSDLDDIVFEKRNKDYGSFILRKNYRSGVIISVTASILLGLISVLVPYFIYLEELNSKIYISQEVIFDDFLVPIYDKDLPEPPTSNANQDPILPDISRFPKLNREQPLIVDSVIAEDSFLESSMDSIMRDQIQQPTGGSGGPAKGEHSNVGQASNHLYTQVDKMPEFKGGGIEEFREWVMKKTKYPKEASIRGIQGKVLISFVIEKDGSVANVEVIKGVDPLIDNEALKSVKSSPRWTPGMVKSEAVRVAYFISVNFEL